MCEWQVDIPPGKIIECLTDRLRLHFNAVSPSESAEQRAERQRQLAATLADKVAPGTTIPDHVLSMLLDSGMVETIPLLINRRDSNFVAVNMYIDDQGSFKKCPLNYRASAICIQAGVPSQVMGDAFLSRMFDNDADFERRDFTLLDLDSQAPWWEAARVQHQESGATAAAQLKTSSGLAGSARRKCAEGFLACDRPAPLKCSRCKEVFYCSAECQRRDWKRHKLSCVK